MDVSDDMLRRRRDILIGARALVQTNLATIRSLRAVQVAETRQVQRRSIGVRIDTMHDGAAHNAPPVQSMIDRHNRDCRATGREFLLIR